MQTRTKTHKKREKKRVEIAKENCWNVFVHQNQIDLPLCNRACLNRGGGQFCPSSRFWQNNQLYSNQGGRLCPHYLPLPPIFRPSVGSVQDIYLCKCLWYRNAIAIAAACCWLLGSMLKISAQRHLYWIYIRDLHNWKKILLRHSTNLKQRYVGPE